MTDETKKARAQELLQKVIQNNATKEEREELVAITNEAGLNSQDGLIAVLAALPNAVQVVESLGADEKRILPHERKAIEDLIVGVKALDAMVQQMSALLEQTVRGGQ